MIFKKYRFFWIIGLVISISLACDLLSNLQEDLSGAGNSLGAIASQAEGMATLVDESSAAATARAFATQIGPAVRGTGNAIATQVEQKGFLQTAQAYVTQEAPHLEATGEALMTQMTNQEFIQTAQALATVGPSDLLATMQAIVTQVSPQNAPPNDIPLLPEVNVTTFFSTQTLVTYSTDLPYEDVISFYQTKMPEQGWAPLTSGFRFTDNFSVMRYDMDGREATITISENPLDQRTVVMIVITIK